MASSKLGNVCLILMLITNFVSCFDSFYEKISRKHELLSVHGLWQGNSGKSLKHDDNTCVISCKVRYLLSALDLSHLIYLCIKGILKAMLKFK